MKPPSADKTGCSVLSSILASQPASNVPRNHQVAGAVMLDRRRRSVPRHEPG